ncbi:diol dehydratase reactivase ATPase-like domain-containing protein [Dactylosporangium matsuzakiense]|uniref:Diol dehydratase reactivase alpha subunit n=1 Tax=Dactylosporangium matsuzakiense TaxID=53360 RepID=A0A9W6KKI2_9ACTN|nr:diol dehydratase reactivase ATPase-like domain-containing protein [Dactylosporangium matsuzakiense]GLL02838.1 hypothetical protein GCM10017581_045800 [Dactylosporangium matsuzakiense]
MNVVGLDIGNATTEAVLARIGPGGPQVLAADRVPTRGPKGGRASLEAAARLVRRLGAGHAIDAVVIAPLRPVTTSTVVRPEPPRPTGRVQAVTVGGTAHGSSGGFAVGTPVTVPGDTGSSGPGRLVAVVTCGFREALPQLLELAAEGRLAAVVTALDEGVLIGNRLRAAGHDVPVADEVPIASVAGSLLLAVEVRPPGQPLRDVTDPLRLADAFGSPEVRDDAAELALFDRFAAVVALMPPPAAPPSVTSAVMPPSGAPIDVDDVFEVDLAAVADAQLARRSALASRTTVVAALRAQAPVADPAAVLAELLGVPVRTASGEASAARLGALSTPGAPADAVVVDLGAGTLDVVTAHRTVTLAGAGELLTEAVAALLGTGRTAAEWAKRGPSFRVDAPQVLAAEDGSRTFTDRPVRGDAVGALVVAGPAGWLPFNRALAPAEWRALRLRLKAAILGGNLARAGLLTPDPDATDPEPAGGQAVIVVGGPAGDDEILGTLSQVLPAGTIVARGNVAGTLGHRHCVAFGLVRCWPT